MELPAQLQHALREAGVAVAYLFGSRARGRPRTGSDADVALLLDVGATPPGLLEQSRLAGALADALGGGEVDLLMLDTARLELRARVLLEGRVLASFDEPRRVRFTVDTLSRWGDVAPAVAEQDRAYLAHVAREGL